MSDKIAKSFLNTPLTLLLIILIILIIFCVMQHKLYNLQSIMFDSDSDSDNSMNFEEMNLLLNSSELIKNHTITLNDIIEKSKSKLKTKENFYELTQDDLNTNLNNLNKLSDNLKTFSSTTLVDIQKIMNNVKTQRLIDKEILLKVLTDIYTLRYLESINQGNAVSYHEYIKYVSPKTNIYYKQYL
jgi:hypothetical protein